MRAGLRRRPTPQPHGTIVCRADLPFSGEFRSGCVREYNAYRMEYECVPMGLVGIRSKSERLCHYGTLGWPLESIVHYKACPSGRKGVAHWGWILKFVITIVNIQSRTHLQTGFWWWRNNRPQLYQYWLQLEDWCYVFFGDFRFCRNVVYIVSWCRTEMTALELKNM